MNWGNVMKRSSVLLAGALLWGCAQDPSAAPDPSADVDVGTGGQLSTLDPQGEADSEYAGCETRRDCAYATVPEVTTEGDCSCPTCAADAEPILRTTLEARKVAYRKVCREWASRNACPPVSCERPRRLACSEEKRCELE